MQSIISHSKIILLVEKSRITVQESVNQIQILHLKLTGIILASLKSMQFLTFPKPQNTLSQRYDLSIFQSHIVHYQPGPYPVTIHGVILDSTFS